MRKRPKIVRFPKPKVADDTQFIETLVFVLDRARAGCIKGYAMVYMVETDEGTTTIEAAKAFEEGNRLHVLGGIRKMEVNFLKREFGE